MNALEQEIHQIISQEGPISVERYMTLALTHPQHGYYMTGDRFGADGDFITAPEISQMFGELLGLWAAEVWAMMGSPDSIRLVELGPGRGTLMSDALRAAQVVDGFAQALKISLVETSPVLSAAQRVALSQYESIIEWHNVIDDVPAGPAIFIANEFFDALPVRQYLSTGQQWHERLIGLDGEERLIFGLAPDPEPMIVARSPAQTVLEVGFAAHDAMQEVASRLARDGGAGIIIDYGHLATGPGETLQAVKNHARSDPLEMPGEADLTAHVDFANLGRAARSAGARVFGPAKQADFLTALGIFQRAAGLKKNATAQQAIEIDKALLRLVSTGREQGAGQEPAPAMGELFKVMGIAAGHDFTELPGFEPTHASQ